MGLTWNYTTVARWVWVRVGSGLSNTSLQQHCYGTFFSTLLFVFSAIKGPAKELRLSFMLLRNMWTKYFYYFQGLRVPLSVFESVCECHWTKRWNCMNYRSKWPLQKTFSSLTPPPAWISRVFEPSPPPSSCENFQNPIPSVGGVWIFSGTTQ